MNRLEKWLDTKTKDDTLPDPYYSTYQKEAYYSNQDIDLKNSSKITVPENNADYADHIYIDPKTNRYHANMLFRMLIDYAYENDLDYELHDPETKKPYLKFNLMDKQLKKSFYQFCFENT